MLQRAPLGCLAEVGNLRVTQTNYEREYTRGEGTHDAMQYNIVQKIDEYSIEYNKQLHKRLQASIYM